jgi:hypothetical protein
VASCDHSRHYLIIQPSETVQTQYGATRSGRDTAELSPGIQTVRFLVLRCEAQHTPQEHEEHGPAEVHAAHCAGAQASDPL